MRNSTLALFGLVGWLNAGAVYGQALPQRSAAPVALTCGTVSPTPQQLEKLRHEVLPFERQRSAAKGGATVVYLPIKVHVVRKTDGSGGLDEAQIYAGLAATNEQFVDAHMQFYVAGPIAHIDDSQYYEFASENEEALCKANDVANVLNLYFTHSATLRGGIVGGYCGTRVFLIYSHANLDRSFTHELGHYFGLIHTFDQSNSANVAQRELVARTNCETTGDWVCDTPADPSERPGATYRECEYVGTITDAQGATYAPPTRNVMAYNFCGNQFTPGQLTRMESWRALYRANLAWSSAQPAAPTNLTATVTNPGATQFQQVRLHWQDNATDELGYFIERATATTDYAAVGVVGPNQAAFVDPAAPANQPVSYRVKPINAAAGFSNKVDVVSGLSYPMPRYVNKDCLPGSTYYQDANYLEEVHLSQGSTPLVTTLGIPCGPYNAFSAAVPLTAGMTYSGQLKSAVKIDAHGGGYYGQQYTALWIDFNRNGSFTDPGELVFSAATPAAGVNLPVTQAFAFTVPPSVSPGLTRMRIRSQQRDADGRVWDPSARAWAGAVEDYGVLLQGSTVSAVAPPTAATLDVYPNPVHDQLLVKLPAQGVWQSIALWDVQGRCVIYNSSLSGGPAALDVRLVAAGVYILEVRSPQTVLHHRIVKR